VSLGSTSLDLKYSIPLIYRSGIGRELTLAALKRGDKVIATTRSQSFHTIQDLQTQGAAILELDVTAHIDELKKIAAGAIKIYGHVDVVMNNAGLCSIFALGV
jgi:NAD(P)-dependent dehydrogenase (short-subunit alcohol dehydrogenase family)